MKSYTIKQLFEIGIISKKLKQVLVILGCYTSEDMLVLSKDRIKVTYIEKSYNLKDELLKALADISELDTILPEFVEDNAAPNPHSKTVRKSKRKFKVGDFTEKLLQESSDPIKVDDLLERIKEYLPDTYVESIRANLNGDPQGRFVFFLDGYVGLTNRIYNKRYQINSIANKKIQYAEQRIMEFMTFIENKHRSPQPHGLDEEESLYRWFLDFTKSTAKETAELRATFDEYLKEYSQWIFTPQEYTYKRNCDQVKWYVDENIELPTAEDEPELFSWFNFQLEYHVKHKDKRKQMFKELLEYLANYGMHFYDVKSAKGKAALSENAKLEETLYDEETDIDKFTRYFTSLKGRVGINEYSLHKALLLTAICNNVQKGLIDSNVIYLTDELLMEFADVCIEYMGTASSYNIAIPYYYMNNEPFWNLIPNEGVTYDDIESIKEPTYDVIENSINCAMIDELLFTILQDEVNSDSLKKVLIDKYILRKQYNSYQKTSQQENQPEDYSIAEEFRTYMMEQREKKTADACVSTLRNSLVLLVNEIYGSSYRSLFELTDAVTVEETLSFLLDNETFKEANKKGHNRFTSTLRHYISFLQQR